ncbi:hypothetical protein SAMN05216474_3135 [Lishizhenia tianjinensis]|uniref:Uncharacterized protein n=1 Tax=Lishizhenia tianjinensis TaxID=477690 RepID=A0A1I7BW71_9FLAO|nr:hypothetical protein [Lishizhenia tianjinensis]SFT91456.1 hypothetical protein SAMN05216474_3135 [Lishizhenia tianjinensis]
MSKFLTIIISVICLSSCAKVITRAIGIKQPKLYLTRELSEVENSKRITRFGESEFLFLYRDSGHVDYVENYEKDEYNFSLLPQILIVMERKQNIDIW